MAIVYQRSKGLADIETHYCPGCAHGIIHRLVAETLEELGVLGNTVASRRSVALSSLTTTSTAICRKAHGRAPAVATGIKRVLP